MYKDIKRAVKVKRFSSVSEMIRDSVRKSLYEEITENGFSPTFEDQIIESEMEPEENDQVWESEADVRKYFKELREKIARDDKAKNAWKIHTNVRKSLQRQSGIAR